MSEERIIRTNDATIHPPELSTKQQSLRDTICEVIHRVTPPYSIALDGPWGSGKTSILRDVDRQLGQGKAPYPTVWFNPWRYRTKGDVVLAFLYQLAQQGKNQFDVNPGKILSALLKSGLDVLTQVTTAGMLDLSTLKEYIEEGDELFAQQDPISQIEDEFIELSARISGKFDKPLIVFIDDMDRCLPEDAIRLLEALRTLFLIGGSKGIFVCGASLTVMQQFLRKRYSEMDTEFGVQYFRKVFEMTIPLKQAIDVYALLQPYCVEDEWFPQFTYVVRDASIRQFTGIIDTYKLVGVLHPGPMGRFPHTILVAVAIKELFPDAYGDLVQFLDNPEVEGNSVLSRWVPRLGGRKPPTREVSSVLEMLDLVTADESTKKAPTFNRAVENMPIRTLQSIHLLA